MNLPTKKFVIMVLLVISSLYSKEYEITQSYPFDLNTMDYSNCERMAKQQIIKEAQHQYIGCDKEVEFEFDIKVIRNISRSLELDKCIVKQRISIHSIELDLNSYLLGEFGSICQGHDSIIVSSNWWHSFEVGTFYSFSDSVDKMKLTGRETTIFYQYDGIPMYGIEASYLVKTLATQFLNISLAYAKSLETFVKTNNNDSIVRNDGDPLISRILVDLDWGLRYKLRMDFLAGITYSEQSISRTYSDDIFNTKLSNLQGNIGLGFLVLPHLKTWIKLSTDGAHRFGISWVL